MQGTYTFVGVLLESVDGLESSGEGDGDTGKRTWSGKVRIPLEVLLGGCRRLESSSTSERLHGRLGSHLGEEVAPAVVVDTRNHLGVDLGDGEA